MDNIGRNTTDTTEKVSDTISEKLDLHRFVTGKLFITGGKGIVGYRVALRLLNSGYPSLRVGFHRPDDECAQEVSWYLITLGH